MRLNNLLLVAGVLGLVFGIGFLLVPAPVLDLYGVQTDPVSVLMSRFFGVALLHLGLALYLLRAVQEPAARRSLVLAGVVGSIAGVIVALIGQLDGIVNALGWSTVVIYGVLLLGYASFLGTRREAA